MTRKPAVIFAAVVVAFILGGALFDIPLLVTLGAMISTGVIGYTVGRVHASARPRHLTHT